MLSIVVQTRELYVTRFNQFMNTVNLAVLTW